jgi:hypothetical protein
MFLGFILYFSWSFPNATQQLYRGNKTVDGRCMHHLHDTRATWRTSYANSARSICVTCARFTPDTRHIRESANVVARTCRARSAQQGYYFWTPLYDAFGKWYYTYFVVTKLHIASDSLRHRSERRGYRMQSSNHCLLLCPSRWSPIGAEKDYVATLRRPGHSRIDLWCRLVSESSTTEGMVTL